MHKKYAIEFIYADNRQLYTEYAELTDEELAQARAFLCRLAVEGEILPCSGDSDVQGEDAQYIFPYTEPGFSGMKDLVKYWEEVFLVNLA